MKRQIISSILHFGNLHRHCFFNFSTENTAKGGPCADVLVLAESANIPDRLIFVLIPKKTILGNLGFNNISITPKAESREIIQSWNIGQGTEFIVFSAYIKAFEPR